MTVGLELDMAVGFYPSPLYPPHLFPCFVARSLPPRAFGRFDGTVSCLLHALSLVSGCWYLV